MHVDEVTAQKLGLGRADRAWQVTIVWAANIQLQASAACAHWHTRLRLQRRCCKHWLVEDQLPLPPGACVCRAASPCWRRT